MAKMSWITVGFGMRAPVTVCCGVWIKMQPPHALEKRSNRPAAHRRAAPMPRVGDVVSDMV
jgi:hypothetical protein